jgi:hypothetical protein
VISEGVRVSDSLYQSQGRETPNVVCWHMADMSTMRSDVCFSSDCVAKLGCFLPSRVCL